MSKIGFFELLIALSIALGCCGPRNFGIEKKIENLTKEIHILNENLIKAIDLKLDSTKDFQNEPIE